MGILQGRILEWVAMASFKGFSQSKEWTQVSCIAGGFFTVWATKEAWPGKLLPKSSPKPTPTSQDYIAIVVIFWAGDKSAGSFVSVWYTLLFLLRSNLWLTVPILHNSDMLNNHVSPFQSVVLLIWSSKWFMQLKVRFLFVFVLRRYSMLTRKNEKKTNVTIWSLHKIFPQKPQQWVTGEGFSFSECIFNSIFHWVFVGSLTLYSKIR